MDKKLFQVAAAWAAKDPDPHTRAELLALIASKDERELQERVGQPLAFGTAGLRGLMGAGPNRMNRAVVRRTTAGLARYLKSQVKDAPSRGVVVGRDARQMSAEFAEDVAAVFAAEGFKVFYFEAPCPTPLVAFALLATKAASAVAVTASHNPKEYNGYKVYWGNGAQIVPPHDSGIAQAISHVEPANEVPLLSRAEALSKGLHHPLGAQMERAYVNALLKERRHPQVSSEISVVYTALHGVGGKLCTQVLSEAGFGRVQVVAEQQEPDGRFPTVAFPNPEEPGALDLAVALAEQGRADLVLANDPDADRLAVLVRDRAGQLRSLSGDEVGVLLGHYLLSETEHSPKAPLLITTLVSSAQLQKVALAKGARFAQTLTGFKWIANRALELEAQAGCEFLFGYEEALGYCVGRVVRDKDGMGAALLFAELAAVCRVRGETPVEYLERISRETGLFVSGQKSFTLPGQEGAMRIVQLMDSFRTQLPDRVGELRVLRAVDYQKGAEGLPPANALALFLEGGSRITLRPSGTEPKIKYYFELCESAAGSDPLPSVKVRAQNRLSALQRAFVELAHARGQP